MGLYFGVIIGIVVLLATLFLLKKLQKPKRKPVNYQVIPATKDEGSNFDNIYFITGGNGFIGSALIQKLQERKINKKIKIFVFDITAPRTKLENVNYIVGDLTNEDHVKRALVDSQADTLYHVASLKPGAGIGHDLLYKINVGGTKNLLKQIQENKEVKINRIIYTSSATIIIGEDDEHLLNVKEDHPYPQKPLDSYTKTKTEAEKLIIGASNNIQNGAGEKVICCSLRPTGIFGFGDFYLAEPALIKGTVAQFVGNGTALIDWIDGDTVALAHVLAEENLHPGSRVVSQIYSIAHTDKMEYRQFLGYQSTGPNGEANLCHWGVAHPKSVPLIVCKVLGVINEFFANYLGSPPFGHGLTVTTIKFTQKSYTFSTEKAFEHFGYQPADTLSNTIKKMAKDPRTFYSNKSK